MFFSLHDFPAALSLLCLIHFVNTCYLGWRKHLIFLSNYTIRLAHTHIHAYTHACAHAYTHTHTHTGPSVPPLLTYSSAYLSWTAVASQRQVCLGATDRESAAHPHCVATLSQTCGHSEQNTVSNLWTQWTKHYLKPVDTVNEMLSQTCGHSEPNVISNMWTQWTKHYFKPVDTVNETLFQTCGHGEQNAISHSYSAFLESCCRFMNTSESLLMKIMKMHAGPWTVNPMPHSMCIVGTQQYRHHADGKCKHSEPHHCIQMKNPQNRKERRLNTTADQVN